MQPPSTLPPLWFKDKQFTGKDDVSNKAAYWSEILEPLQNKSPNILLIGSGDGRSALFFLNYLPDSQLTCIDRFNGAHEARFDRNLSEFAPRVRKLKGYSFASLSALRQEDCQFDVIFIAARHQREAMLLDSALSWPMLRKGGVLIWDYYRRNRSSKPRWRRPTSAIDGFLLAYRGEYEELFRGNEMIVRKTVAAPALPGAMLRPAERRRSVIGAFRSLLRPIQQLLLAVRRRQRLSTSRSRNEVSVVRRETRGSSMRATLLSAPGWRILTTTWLSFRLCCDHSANKPSTISWLAERLKRRISVKR